MPKISKQSKSNWNNNKILVLGEPFTFATKGELIWREIMMNSIPEKFEKNYSGVELKFHYVSEIHGQPLDVDNLCEPVFIILVGKKNYFDGVRKNIQWFRAEKIQDNNGKLELSLSEQIPKLNHGLILFDEIYVGPFPKSATDPKFPIFVKNNLKRKLEKTEECIVSIQFNSSSVNIGNISSGTIKPIIDCLFPVLGGIQGDPNDHVIRILQIEKGITSIPQDGIRIVISRLINE